MEKKAILRRAIKERLARMSENDRRVESAVIVRELSAVLPHAPAHIAMYAPYLDEPNITPLISKLLEQKNVICMGKVEGNRMTMHRIRSLADVHRNPITNILEPNIDAPIDETAIDTAIVPGRAFTKNGHRMGRGNGGYDIWISAQRKRNHRCLFIGVCFDCQLVSELPVEPHDEEMDMVITSTNVWKGGKIKDKKSV